MSAMCAVKEEATTLHLLWMQSMPSAKLGVFKHFNKNISFSVLFITIPCILCVLDVFTLNKNFRQMCLTLSL